LKWYGGRSRETVDFMSGSIKGTPRLPYRATGCGLTPAIRLRHPPMITLSCITQHANIRLINRRVKFPCSCHYNDFSYMKNFQESLFVGLDRRHIISEGQ
jgi:hypothetical protein